MVIFVFLYILILANETSTQTFTIQNTESSLNELRSELISITEIIKSKIEVLDNEKEAQNYKAILTETLEKINNIKTNQELNEKEDNFTQALLKVRKALISFYIKTNRYPLDLNELIPNFIKSVPQIKINSNYSNSIKYIRTTSFDRDYTKAIDSTTTYIYFSDPKSSYWGFFIINSTDTFNDTPYYKY